MQLLDRSHAKQTPKAPLGSLAFARALSLSYLSLAQSQPLAQVIKLETAATRTPSPRPRALSANRKHATRCGSAQPRKLQTAKVKDLGRNCNLSPDRRRLQRGRPTCTKSTDNVALIVYHAPSRSSNNISLLFLRLSLSLFRYALLFGA